MSKTRIAALLGAVCFLSVSYAELQAAIPAKGLIGYWKFDEAKGQTVADSSGLKNNGRIHGPTWAAGRVGSALKFDGVDDYVDIPKYAALDSLKQITLMAWVNSSLTERGTIVERWLFGGKNNERAFEMDIDPTKDRISFALSDTGSGGKWTSTLKGVRAGKWTHIAVTSDGLTMKLYINGELNRSVAEAPAKIHASTANLHIGAWYGRGKWFQPFKGLIDEVSIHSRALKADEILKNFVEGSAKGGVEGLVRDKNKKPIAGATVKVGLFSTTTGADGRYTLADVPEGVYRITAIKKGYQRKAKRNLEIEADEDAIVNFKLTPDTTAPTISAVKTENLASLTTEIVWTTDEPADSKVLFGGPTSSGYTGSAGDSAYTTSHRVALTNLKPGITYHYQVVSTDRAENSAKSKGLSFKTGKVGDVIIWDSNKKYLMKGPLRHVMADRDKWTQVPYGVTDYTFRGDPVIQNKYSQLFLFTNKEDSIDYAARLDTGGLAGNEIYKVNDIGKRCFGMGTTYTKILENTPDKMVVEHAGLSMRRGKADNVITNYTMWANKPWLHIRPVEFVNQQGMHGKTRICAFVLKDGGEVIFDSKRAGYKKDRNVKAPPGTIGIINFDRNYASKYDFMWFLMLSPGAEKNRRTYLGLHWDPFWGEEVSPDRPSVGAQYVYMEKSKPAAIAPLGYRNCWTRENVEKPIKTGGTYTTKFAAPYPARWRLIGRVGEKYYAADVNITKADVAARKKFTFTSKADGKLDYVLMYMRDKNDDTPKDVYTPMDAYRQAIGGK
ncbi:MAG: carboxypeptidase regulatory-like domain-containing protein [Phycisphaerae bacterium]|nr:carboxypeptidase regulatory-like domain-containing protein [Phycisphaerae bacterium]